METRELLKIDLNLLIALQVLLDEKSVSRAAERLFITQPAMSKTLSRLRKVFDDPLFTRSSRGMRPTPRALELADDLEKILNDIQRLVSADFDPATWRGELTIALSEYIGVWLLPLLMARIHIEAPGLTLKTITRVENQLRHLADGSLDVAIHIKHSYYGDDFIRESLGGDVPVLLARRAHPLAGRTLTWKALSDYPFVRLYISDREELEVFRNRDDISERIGREQQRGWFETSHLLTALEVLRQTDFLMPAPPLLLGSTRGFHEIRALSMPADIDYRIEYLLVRHRRTENSPIHNWLWARILEVLRELRGRVMA